MILRVALSLLLVTLVAAPQSLFFPAQVRGFAATYFGVATGTTTYYYWIQAIYPQARSPLTGPVSISNARALTPSNSIGLSWQQSLGAIGYDVMRKTDPATPVGACNCAIAIGLTATSLSDRGLPLTTYTVTGDTGSVPGGGGGLGDPGANGVVVRIAPATTTARTITGTANEIDLTDGNGVLGNPTIAISDTLDLSGNTSTKPSKTGTSLPGTCSTGETFIKTDAVATNQLYICTSPNTWTAQGGGGGSSHNLLSSTHTDTTPASGSVGDIIRFTGTTWQNFAKGAQYTVLQAGATDVVYGAVELGQSAATAGQLLASRGGTGDDTSGTTGVPRISAGNWTYDAASSHLTDGTTLALKATIQSGGYQWCRSTTGNDTYTCTLTPVLTAYTRGGCLVLDADTANTGAATVNVDSLGAKSILNRAGAALADGDITANKPITICYDGTQYIIQGDGGGGGGGTPGGSNTQMQYNNSGAFGGSPLLYQPGAGAADLAFAVTYTSPTGSRAGFEISTTNNPTANSTISRESIFAEIIGSGSFNHGLLAGGSFSAYQLGSGNVSALVGLDTLVDAQTTGTVTTMAGFRLTTSNAGNTVITELSGAKISSTFTSSPTVTDFYGIFIPAPSGGTPTITNNYGLFIGNRSTGTNRWAIKTGTGRVDFGSADSLIVPSSAGVSPTLSGNIAYDTTSNTLEYGENGTNRTLVNTSRTISTTSPITGGGDLSANRTIECATCGVTTSGLGQFASTTSSALAGVISDETGSGLLVFGTSPSLIGTPVIGDGAGNDKLSFTAESSNPTCSAGNYFIWSNSTDTKLKKCENGTITDLDTGGGGGSPGGSGSEVQYRAGASTFGAVTNSAVSGSEISLNAGDTPASVLRVTTNAAAASNTRDSGWFLLQGTSNDGSAHTVDWKHFNDVTSNAGASTWTLQSRIDGAAYANRLTVTDGSVVGATIFDAGTGFRIAGAAASGQYARGNGTNIVLSAVLAADLPTSTHRILVLNGSTIPDTSGNVFSEPYSIKATSDFFVPLVWIFNDTSTDLILHGHFEVPQNFVSGAKFCVVWTSTATSGNVRWQFGYRTVGGDDTTSLDQASTEEAPEVNDAAPTAAHRRLTLCQTLTDSNFAVGETVQYRLVREGSDTSNDTMAAAAILFEFVFEYTGRP